MSCPYCPTSDPEQQVIFANDFVLFLQNERYQGALKHSGVIIPVQHKEDVFVYGDIDTTNNFFP
jgi:histidine triad (HIT) family protein